MLAKGYEVLGKRVRDERIKQLLEELNVNELNESEYWSQKIQQLTRKDVSKHRDLFMNRRIGLMMVGILGTRRFFEWVIIAEDESVEDLATRAVNIGDLTASEEWIRIASDELLHIEKMKKEVLGIEGREMEGGGVISDSSWEGYK